MCVKTGIYTILVQPRAALSELNERSSYIEARDIVIEELDLLT